MLFTEERLRQATLLRLKITQIQQIALRLSMLRSSPAVMHSRLRFETAAFEILLADVCSLDALLRVCERVENRLGELLGPMASADK